MELPSAASMKLAVSNAPDFKKQTDDWVKAVKSTTQAAAAGLARRALVNILGNSPQNSGDFVANWKVSLGAPNYTMRFWPGSLHDDDAFSQRELQAGGEPYKQGDRPAISYALAQASGPLAAAAAAPLGTRIYVANASVHEGDAYAVKIERDQINFRDENLRRQPFALLPQAMTHISRRYKRIGRAELQILSKIGV